MSSRSLLRGLARRPAATVLVAAIPVALAVALAVAELGAEPTREALTGITTIVAFSVSLALGIVVALVVASQVNARDAAQELAERRTAQLDAVVRHAPDALLVVDALDIIVLASDRVADLIGRDADELVGSNIRDFLPEGLRSTVARHVDGHIVPIEIAVSAVPDDHVRGFWIAALRETRDRRDAERALRAAYAKLSETEQMRTTFMTTVSHELRTPLTVIGGFANLLRTRWSDLTAAQRDDALARLERNTIGLRHLIEELLDFANMEVEHAPLDLTDEAIGEFVAKVADDLAPLLGGHRVEFAGDDIVLPIDREITRRMLANLLSNAARYSPDGAAITVSVAIDGDHAVLRVDDKGPGVPAEDRDRIFEPFWRADDRVTLETKGTGIGLAVVAELIERVGGAVDVLEAPGGGARFEVRLPRVVPVPPPVELDLRDPPVTERDEPTVLTLDGA